ncbi:hypothetical protein [Serinibacter salmoneus]|uniref:Uncharacterized protein n=1 Tax=Serinibacter salmoneus TaxID=556530 RepID=A0A2A9D385_9MICO|nr:hypothetical protein [Serinibacter salmoneus]PFG20715.1 hypothetical protein ATL40_2325 [Serinibacter salmoneus]
MKPLNLDLSTMVARVLLAVLVAATVVLTGLWLRASDALTFVSTLLAVTAGQLIAAGLRGQRIGPPTAASQRFQPLVDTLAAYPGGSILGRAGFKRGVVALAVGFVVAIGSAIVAGLLFASVPMAPLWRSTLALGVVLLPVNGYLAWSRSRQEYTGTRFAGQLADALRQVVRPGDQPSTASAWRRVPTMVRVAVVGVGRTALTLIGRVLIQLAIPAVFATPVSIAAVVVAVITWIAGAPVFAALGRSLTKPTPTPTHDVADVTTTKKVS